MRPLFVLLALAATAQAAANRYNEPPPAAARAPLVARVEQLIVEIAHDERREAPRVDARLERACEDLARHAPADGRPSNELVQAAMWLNGLVEPPPHLIMASVSESGDEEMIRELRRQVPSALSQGRYKRMGVALIPAKEGRTLVIALGESGVDLEPVPRALPSGGPTPLRGRLLPPYERPELLVTAPGGQVTRLPSGGDATHFASTFHCGPQKGRYQIEIVGEDRFGSSVLANFPVYCGSAAPSMLPSSSPAAAEQKWSDAAGAEAILVKLVNRDRARAGLAPLEADARLHDVARGHSADMHAHGFVGHISPTTGSAGDRCKRANIDATLIAENVARAYSPEEAERGLMESPGHRANILNKDVSRIGVGVVVSAGVGGARELLVTQVFIRPPEKLQPGSVSEVRRKLDELRHGRRLKTLDDDSALDEVAQATAQDIARGALRVDAAGEPMERALTKLAHKFKSVRSVVASGGTVAAVVGGLAQPLSDPSATTAGIGLAVGKRPDGSAALFAVVVLAERR